MAYSPHSRSIEAFDIASGEWREDLPLQSLFGDPSLREYQTVAPLKTFLGWHRNNDEASVQHAKRNRDIETILEGTNPKSRFAPDYWKDEPLSDFPVLALLKAYRKRNIGWMIPEMDQAKREGRTAFAS